MKSTAIIFILLFLGIMGIPCVMIAWIGVRLINKLGRYPSKTPALQLSIFVKLIIIEVVSFTLLLVFFKILIG